jgi:hypothetical protein
VPFSAVRFLRQVPVEQARRRRVRELLLLALRTAALVLLALSFARPYLVDSEAAAGAPLTVIAMDASLSVSTPDQVATRARAGRAGDRRRRRPDGTGARALRRAGRRGRASHAGSIGGARGHRRG